MKKLTKKRVVREALSICEQYPDLINPQRNASCQYFVKETNPGESQRCLIGEMLNRRGYDVRFFDGGAAYILRENIPEATETARRTASEIQDVADGTTVIDGDLDKLDVPRPWREVAKWIRETYPEYVKDEK